MPHGWSPRSSHMLLITRTTGVVVSVHLPPTLHPPTINSLPPPPLAGIARNVYRHCTQPDIQAILTGVCCSTSECGNEGSDEALDMRCEHVNADCERFLGTHASFNRCIHFVEHHASLLHVDRTLDKLFLRCRESRKLAPTYMLDDIAFLAEQLLEMLPDAVAAMEAETRNRFEVVSSDSGVPSIRSPGKWLRGVYAGTQRAWSPPGHRQAGLEPWLVYVQRKLELAY